MGQWIEDPAVPSGWRYDSGKPEQGYPDPGSTTPPRAYAYSDPITDAAWPRISAPDGELPGPPPEWGRAPTERDLAAMRAGNT